MIMMAGISLIVNLSFRFYLVNCFIFFGQIEELKGSLQNDSNADIILLGGDLNADPELSAYRKISSFMDNCAEAYVGTKWDNPTYYTWCHPRNTFTGSHCNYPRNKRQRRIDHFFMKTRKPEYFELSTHFYGIIEPRIEINQITISPTKKVLVSYSEYM